MNTPSAPVAEESVRNLVQQLERAQAAGRQAEAQQWLARAKKMAPGHPWVLNAESMHELRCGRPETARALAEKAIAKDAANTSFWVNLASACRALELPEEEMKALDQALALEPRHLLALLQKASLLELEAKPRDAAKLYRNALQTIPAGSKLPEFLRQPLEHAIQAVKENDALLEDFLRQRLRPIQAHHAQADRERFEHCLGAMLGQRRIFTVQPTFLHFPKLPAWEFHTRSQFPWLDGIEAATATIRAEFEQVFAEDTADLEPYVAYPQGVPLDQWAELNHSRRWSVFYLWRNGKPVPEHVQRCPRTAALMAHVPKVDIPHVGPTVFFSILDAKSHIPAHTGVTNTRLTVHVPLVIPSGCRFRVGSQTRAWQPGAAWVFDDTIEHEAWNDSELPRAVLIFDIWNPHLTDAERDLVRATVTSVSEYYGRTPMAESH